MASPPFYVPFSHWESTPFQPPYTSITTSKFLTGCLVIGLANGELLILSTATGDPTPRARLCGHKTLVVALEPLLVRTETTEQELLLSLDSVGTLCKWSLADGRCLQNLYSTISSKPRGLRIVKKQKADSKDPVVVIYGASTEILVLNAETLETVLLWTGNLDWPLLVVSGRSRVMTLLPDGQVQGWGLDSRSLGEDGRGRLVLAMERDHTKQFSVEIKEDMGRIRGFERVSEKSYVIIQKTAVSSYALEDAKFVLKETTPVDLEIGVAGYQVVPKKGIRKALVMVWSEDGQIRVFELGENTTFGKSISLSLNPVRGKSTVISIACTRYEDKYLIAAFSHLRPDSGREKAHGDFAMGVFSTNAAGADIEWAEKNEALTSSSFLQDDVTSSCSTIFANMLAIAYGSDIRLHSLSSFLLAYHEPIKEIHIPTTARICLLKRVRVGEHVAHGKDAGINGGKEYLIVGTTNGELFIIEAPSFQPSSRLPLSSTPVCSANLLLSNLGKRLRFTLIASSADGTASIVDVERARIMVTFPSHDYSPLVSYATKTAQNTILLTYGDYVRREWDLGEEDGGVLKTPPSSRGSDRDRGTLGTYERDLAEEGWREVRVGKFEFVEEDREDEGDEANGDGTIKNCEKLCERGLPTASVNVRAVLDLLGHAVKIAKERTRASERRVVGNHPALITAKSLLTSLVPGGIEELLGWEEDDYEWRTSVQSLFFRRKKPAVLGQMGAGKNVSILVKEALNETEDGVWGISPTVSACVLLAALATVGGLLEASENGEFFDKVIRRALSRLAITKNEPALGVFAKYWMDENPIMRATARKCLSISVGTLSEERRTNTIAYWAPFLPVQVPPELFSSKEVVRSVIILGQLIADHPDSVEQGLKKCIALSVELLLGDSNPSFQDTAIELVGHGWTTFQSLFDPFEVIHILIRISASTMDDFSEARRKTLKKCILEIAEKNSPLLGSGLANNISYGSSSSQPAALAAISLSTALGVSVAAMRIVTMIVREDAILFRDVLGLIITAVVKILDPNGGLREKVMPTITELINEMVEAYPTIAFHRPTQRLALSISPGIIMIYDLKTSTGVNALQGHHSLANFLSFSIDGKFLVAVDLEENMFFVWKFVTGILSFIGGGSDGTPAILPPKRKEPFENERNVGIVEIEWTGERSVKVTAGDQSTVFQNIDSTQGSSWNIL
ncbi:hypothetical protein L873DRAFT_1797690 [Choiromyces venosus 120613-1]|uniref:WD40 repeat-like protein n=1 Tax=Choiromyces venosus 120613-1 TaxID=1336337 RepID=A0A3N4KHL1_9PEZI|nr:hypothetical protein L873DRAFT_1797690 [Choiromyces venosus 120613-1]